MDLEGFWIWVLFVVRVQIEIHYIHSKELDTLAIG